MNREQFTKIMSYVMAAIEKKPSKSTIEVYYDLLKDLDYDLAFAAVKKVIASDEYPVLPTVGKIRKAAHDLCTMDRLSAPEAWGIVVKAIRKYGYCSEAEALASMPKEVAETVKFIGWRELCLSEKPDVIRAQFMRMYEAVEARQKERELLPDSVKQILTGISKKMLTGGTSLD